MRYVWGADYGLEPRWYPRDEILTTGARPVAPVVMTELRAPFVSPVDGRPVTNRRELRDHNRTHGVVDRREFTGHRFSPEPLSSPQVEVVRAYKEATGKL